MTSWIRKLFEIFNFHFSDDFFDSEDMIDYEIGYQSSGMDFDSR